MVKIQELVDLVIYSFKQVVLELGDMVKAFRKPRTWSFIFYMIFAYGLYHQDVKLILVSLVVIIVIYIFLQKIDGEYRNDKFVKDLTLNRDTYIVKEYYRAYKKKNEIINKCKDISKEPLLYTEWKESELRKYYSKQG